MHLQMASHSPVTNKIPGEVISDLAAALALVMGFGLGSAWCFLYPGNAIQLLVVTITPIALTAIFYRARE